MSRLNHPAGFTAPADADAPERNVTFPTLIATLSLVVSIAIVLTAVTMSTARAAQLF